MSSCLTEFVMLLVCSCLLSFIDSKREIDNSKTDNSEPRTYRGSYKRCRRLPIACQNTELKALSVSYIDLIEKYRYGFYFLRYIESEQSGMLDYR